MIDRHIEKEEPRSRDSSSLLIFLFSRCFLNLCDCCFLHRDSTVLIITKLYDKIIICNVDDYSVETACCKYGITDFHLCDHLPGSSSALFSVGARVTYKIDRILRTYTKTSTTQFVPALCAANAYIIFPPKFH